MCCHFVRCIHVLSMRATLQTSFASHSAPPRSQDVLAMRVILVPAADAASQLAALMRKSSLSQHEVDALLCFSAYRQARTCARTRAAQER